MPICGQNELCNVYICTSTYAQCYVDHMASYNFMLTHACLITSATQHSSSYACNYAHINYIYSNQQNSYSSYACTYMRYKCKFPYFLNSTVDDGHVVHM